MAGVPKPPELRQRRHDRGDFGNVARDPLLPIPPARDRWLRSTVADWEEYWTDDASAVVRRKSELTAVRRLFDYRDERERAYRAYTKRRTSEGSTKQRKLSPEFEAMNKLEKLILPLEDRYGLNSIARLRLGATLGGNNGVPNTPQYTPGVNDDDDNGEIINLPGLPRA